jgi:hypothetical protein
MNKRTIIIVIIVLFVIIASYLVVSYVFRPADTDVASRKADFETEVSALVNEFMADEDGSYARYLNKIIVVKGTVYKISEEMTGLSVYLKEPEDMAGVICSFHMQSFNASKVTVGEKVSIKGKCTGYLFDVVLTKCVLQND